MIRRRVIENLRNQQWTAVGIELMIVVLGVFIGLQASNWNQDRLSAGQAATFAERLTADLRAEDWYYQLQIVYNRQVLANANRAASALEGKTTMSDEARNGQTLPWKPRQVTLPRRPKRSTCSRSDVSYSSFPGYTAPTTSKRA